MWRVEDLRELAIARKMIKITSTAKLMEAMVMIVVVLGF